jgi:large subunit ribosomal protein L7/L12
MSGQSGIERLSRQLAALEDRVARLEASAGGTQPPPPDPTAPSTYVRHLAADGRTIEAIKEYRRETGAGLKEAKERIEELGP